MKSFNYYNYMLKTSLRKNSLNADFHIHSLEDPNTGEDIISELQYKHLVDIIGSAILKGLDIIGIVSRHSYNPGLLCQQIIKEKGYDLLCIPGVEVQSSEKINTIVYNSKVIPSQGLSIEDICKTAHKNGGVVMAIQPSRRNVQRLNKMIKNNGDIPDFIEIFNDITQGGYSKSFIDTDPDPDFQLLMNSASRNAKDLDISMMVSRIPRKILVEKGVLSDQEGINFVPKYLTNIQGVQDGVFNQ